MFGCNITKNQTNTYVSGDKKQCTCMCLIPNHHKRMYVWSQTISKRECVRNVCGTCFFCVWYVGKNRAYAYVYASLWQTRCVCMQIYIKSIANAHVLCALLTYHNKRACVWLENRKRLRFFSIAAHFLVFRKWNTIENPKTCSWWRKEKSNSYVRCLPWTKPAWPARNNSMCQTLVAK